MYERFTDRARRVVVLAEEESKNLNHPYIGSEHILLGLLEDDSQIAAKVIMRFGVTTNTVREEVMSIIGTDGSKSSKVSPFTPRSKKILELATREALQLWHNYIGSEHLLLGLIREGEGLAVQILINQGVDLAELRKAVIDLIVEEGSLSMTVALPYLDRWKDQDADKIKVRLESITASPMPDDQTSEPEPEPVLETIELVPGKANKDGSQWYRFKADRVLKQWEFEAIEGYINARMNEEIVAIDDLAEQSDHGYVFQDMVEQKYLSVKDPKKMVAIGFADEPSDFLLDSIEVAVGLVFKTHKAGVEEEVQRGESALQEMRSKVEKAIDL